MLEERTQRVFTFAATQFLPDGALDFDCIVRMIDVYIEKGANGLTILGLMGAAGKLSTTAFVPAIRCVTSRCAIPVPVAVSAQGFAAMTALSNKAMETGAVGVMVAPPMGLQTGAQIASYLQSTADALGDIPFVLQGFLLAMSVNIHPRLFSEKWKTARPV